MKKLFILTLVAVTFLSACGDDDTGNDEPTTAELTLNISGLEDLGSEAQYEVG